jgi:hypothetical protein
MFAQDAFVQVRLKERNLITKKKNRLLGGFIFLSKKTKALQINAML